MFVGAEALGHIFAFLFVALGDGETEEPGECFFEGLGGVLGRFVEFDEDGSVEDSAGDDDED